MVVELWMWLTFTAFIIGMLALDLFAFHREAHTVSMKEAAVWSTIWITLGLSFGAILWWWQGATVAGEYLGGYLIEKALSVDNIFVFALLFSYFALPDQYQHRVLFYGILGALIFRGAFIAGGVALLESFHWTIYVFGAFLVVTGVRMATHNTEEIHPDKNPVLRLLRRIMPITPGYHGQRFFVRLDGKRAATPLLAVLVAVETTDIIFAVDSIPAIFAITREPFLVFTSNAFAILGLRALYFLLAGMIRRFGYLKLGLSAVLVFVGLKMLIAEWVKIPIAGSLVVIALLIGTSVAASLLLPPKVKDAEPGPNAKVE